MIEPYRAPAPSYNYAPPPPPRPVYYVPPPPVRFGVVIGPGYGYYRAAVWILWFTPVLRPPRLLARAPSSLALKVCVEAAVSAAAQVKAVMPVLRTRLLRFRFDFRKSRLLQLLIQRGNIGLQ